MDDWSNILPLKEIDAKSSLGMYLTKCSVSSSAIDHKNNKTGKKSPDLLVTLDNYQKYLLEIKTPGHYIDPVSGMYLWNSVYKRIVDRMRTARKQFESYDPYHSLPWVVAITVNHPMLNFNHFQHYLKGEVILNGSCLADFKYTPEYSHSKKSKTEIDLILWCQVNRLTLEIYETVHFINKNSDYIYYINSISKRLELNRRETIEY